MEELERSTLLQHHWTLRERGLPPEEVLREGKLWLAQRRSVGTIDDEKLCGMVEDMHHVVLHHLGMASAKLGNLDHAEEYLFQASEHLSGPVALSFGPRFGLARELYRAGRKNAVRRYFDSILKSQHSIHIHFRVNFPFVSTRRAMLSAWLKEIDAGNEPDWLHLL